MNRFRTPAILIITPVLALPIWYYLNTDKIGSVLFGEPLYYCNVINCIETRNRFLVGVALLVSIFVVGLVVLITRTRKLSV